jgi:O-antigen/teichoic acid export membrane protein
MLRRALVAVVPDSWKRASLKRNVITNWVSTCVNVGLSFALVPLVVRALDKELYGVWSFLNGLTVYSNLIYMGLGAAFMKNFSEARGRGDTPALTRLLGVAFSLYMFLGGLCLAVAVAMSPFIPRMFATPLSAEAERATTICAVLLGVRILCFFVASAFSALLAAHGRMDLVSGTGAVGACLRTWAAVLAIRLPNPLVGLTVVVVAEALWQLGVMALLGRFVADAVRLTPVWPTRAELRSLYGFGFQAFLVQLGAALIAYTDTALVGVILGAASVTSYALPLQLIEYGRVLGNGVTMSLLPEVSAARARGDMGRIKQVYLRAGRVCAALAAFINVHLIILGPAFLGLWVGPAFVESSRSILLLLGIAAIAGSFAVQVLGPFFQALDVLKASVVITLLEAVLNLGLSIVLAQRIGLTGVALATALPACLVGMLLAPRYMLPKLGVSAAEFGRGIVAPAAALAITTVATQALISVWLDFDSYALLMLRVAASVLTAIPAAMWLFPREEWQPFVPRWVRL